MEDKKGTKHECSPFAGGSPLPDDAEIPPPTPSGSLPPLGSALVVSSYHPCTLVFKQGNASEKTPMIDPSSFIVDSLRDEELTRKLFADLNRDILGPPGDGKIIVLDDSDDDGEAQEEKTASIEFTVAPASTDDALVRQRSIIVMIRGPTRRPMAETTTDVAPVILRLPPRTRCYGRGALRMHMTHYSAFSLFLLCSL
jgi:hypothetical protein